MPYSGSGYMAAVRIFQSYCCWPPSCLTQSHARYAIFPRAARSTQPDIFAPLQASLEAVVLLFQDS